MGCSCPVHLAFISFILYLSAHEIKNRFLHVALERTLNYFQRNNQMNTKCFVNATAASVHLSHIQKQKYKFIPNERFILSGPAGHIRIWTELTKKKRPKLKYTLLFLGFSFLNTHAEPHLLIGPSNERWIIKLSFVENSSTLNLLVVS